MAYRMKPTKRARHRVCCAGVVASAAPVVEPALRLATALCPGKPNGGADGPYSQVSLRHEESGGDPRTFPMVPKLLRKIRSPIPNRPGRVRPENGSVKALGLLEGGSFL